MEFLRGNHSFKTRKEAEQLITDACIGAYYMPVLINGVWCIARRHSRLV